MKKPALLGVLLVAAALPLGGFLTAAAASAGPASPQDEANFLEWAHHFAVPGTDAKLLSDGYYSCHLMAIGQSPEAAGISPMITNYAYNNLCPPGGGSHQQGGTQQGGTQGGGGFVDTLKSQYGITIDSDAAADMAKTACSAPIMGVGLYNAEVAMQQRYPRYDLNTVSRVMGAGVVAYCPGRLP